MPGQNIAFKQHADTPSAQDFSLANLPGDILKHIGSFLVAEAHKSQKQQFKALAQNTKQTDPDEADASASASTVAARATPTANESLQALKALTETSTRLGGIFQPAPMLERLRDNAVTELVTLVLYGRKEEAEAMIRKNPGLLRASCKAPLVQIQVGADTRDYDNVTAYEAALYSADVCANKGNHEEMVEMMHTYFDQMEGGEGERQAQFDTVFPDGVEAITADQEQKAQDFKTGMLQTIITAIDDASPEDVVSQLEHKTVTDNNNTGLAQAFEAFRNEFKRMSLADKHENLNYLMEAFDAFAAKGNKIGQWWRAASKSGNCDKLDLYWRMVIGYVQAVSLAENTKQAFYQGLHNYVGSNLPLGRRDSFPVVGGDLSLSLNSSGAGFDCASSGGARPPAVAASSTYFARGFIVARFRCYVTQKQENLQLYRSRSTLRAGNA